ncbi:Vegetative incompatibility protein HET-E-1 [Colletotrichum siamense]|uniref:Vegetative incompatibility protein HET-E-1 n=1 Tax=Colletotrichum siamense TaxID=690259 RepID=UPI001872BBE9|nr:Vegetative incompatibility protein HET-E-1 [Colletotrichum siamense]KAF5501408.1 Vegetative incompatibility protein HET-E-1 [Colletotrichum siamense]
MDFAGSDSASVSGAGTSEIEDKDAYTVGWICALPLEMAAANLMLDKIYDIQIEQDNADHNSYILGSMRGHNVVIACLPDGIYGTTPAATVAKDMLRTFESIRFGLLVGIGGGAPSLDNDIRLGDVVVSKPTGTSGGVIQYDRGKTTQHEFERTESLNSPPNVLLAALNRLKARQLLGESGIPHSLSEAAEKITKPRIRQKFTYQGESNDSLFQAEYDHVNADSNCDACDPTQTIQREDRDDTDPVVHYGNIASGNQVIKHGKTRDRLRKELGVLCFEMEAAGLMQEFPCLVIRGICDYSDAHKNKRWQEYSATTAAAFAKELLSIVSPMQVKRESKVIIDPKLYISVSQLRNDIRHQGQEQEARIKDEKDQKCLRALSRTDSFVDKEHILGKKGRLLRNSYRWIIDNSQFKQWRNSTQSRRLWIKGHPGKGKTMLLCGLIEELENSNKLCYFFCQASEERLRTANAVLRGLILHLVRQYPKLISHVRDEYDSKFEATFEGYNAWQYLCKILESMLRDDYLGEVLVIVDALDECTDLEDRKRLLRFLCKISAHYRAKLVLSSRNWPDIQMELGRQEDHAVTISLELNANSVSDAVQSYIDQKMEDLAQIKPYKDNADLCCLVRDHLIHNSDSTFLWVALVCQELSGSRAKSRRKVNSILNRSPSGLDDLYARMIENIFDSEDSEESMLCMEILAVASVAKRPITFRELFHTITLSLYQDLEPEELKTVIECCGSFLNIQEDTIYFVHQSAVEFLHSGTSKLPNVAERHYSMFWNSLDALSCSKHLKRDIYDLKAPDVSCADINRPTADPISTLHYCCAYWVDHLVDWAGTEREISTPPSSLMNPDVIGKIQSFLNDKFLYWVEALSLLHP